MNRNFLRMITFLLILLMQIPLVFGSSGSHGNRVVVVGSIDPSLGYDEVVNGTTTFIVPRNKPVYAGKFYHNVTQRLLKVSRIETTNETPSSYYDPMAGKYFVNVSSLETIQTSVPDPSGRVTAFSNIVFQGTGWTEKRKSFMHPDGTSQSILRVTGQATGDDSSRYLIVKIYNSKYPSGCTVAYTVVSGGFEKSYDVTGIVVGREINQVGIVVTTSVGRWNINADFEVSTVGADIYIVMIPDVATAWVSSIDEVRAGVERASMVKPLVQLSTWKGLTYLEIVDMSNYQSIIQNPENVRPLGFYGESGIIVVNAHGEVFPVPPGISWDSWLDTISLDVQTKGLTWVQVAGYPFYYYSTGSYSSTTIGSPGFQRFLQRILGSNTIDCGPNQEGYAVPLQGGYSNRLWGYGLVSGGLHEGRPLKISSSINLADLLDVMGYISGGIEYLTLSLIGFASPNEQLSPYQQVGYYVHSGALWSDSDYNKGKYSMAVAAWTKISILAVDYKDMYYTDPYGFTWHIGAVKSEVAWSYAVPPSSSIAPWIIRFVTTTIAYMVSYSVGPGLLNGAWAPLKVTGSSSTTAFQFISAQSTTLYDASQNSWQNTIAQGVLWTAIAVILIPFTAGTSWVAYATTIGLGFVSTVTSVAWQSPSPVTSGSYIDLAMEDLSKVQVQDTSGNIYLQLQSYGVTETYLARSSNGGASETLTFTLGQKGRYYVAAGGGWAYYPQQTSTFQTPIVVQPYISSDVNNPPVIPSTPSGPTSGYIYRLSTYSTSTTDPESDYIRYKFDWGDGSTTTTGEYESGNVTFASYGWSSSGTYNVKVRAQDSTGAWSDWSQSLTVYVARPDVAVTEVTAKERVTGSTVAGMGYTSIVDITGKIQNQGPLPLPISVTVYIGVEKAGVQTKLGKFSSYSYLAAGAFQLFTVTWETTPQYNAYGWYRTWTRTPVLSGETDTADNFLYGNDILVLGPGDFDGDGYVGPLDLSALSTAYGKKVGQTGWNPYCDLDGDGYVGPIDLSMFTGSYYGKTYTY